MNAQLSLLDLKAVGAHRRGGSETSLHAARVCRADSQRARIMSTLAANQYGMTTEELEDELGVVRNTLAARLRVMEKDELVERFGQRLNRAGNPMTIWFVRRGATVDVAVTGGRL